jgi:3'(2'), 5'-bisphosphate nucleotidase
VSSVDHDRAAEVALDIARQAAEIVMRVYAAPFEVDYKAKDDPVTRADREANEFASARLAEAFPGQFIVAEESDPKTYEGFAGSDATWFVDPLDGTREFVARNGEFAVMLGLAERGRASVGVIVAPVWGRSFVGIVGRGAWEVAADGSRHPIHVSSHGTLSGSSFVVSRSRNPERVKEFALAVGAREAVSHGSSGLKGVLVALGRHDVYYQPGNAGMRWDACATEALVRAAGGECTDADGGVVDYGSKDLLNGRGLLATNGVLHPAMLHELARRR